MRNSEISQVLAVIAMYENILDGGFKARAYDKASRVITSLSEDISHMYEIGGLEEILNIPGVGEGIGKKIDSIKTKFGCTDELR